MSQIERGRNEAARIDDHDEDDMAIWGSCFSSAQETGVNSVREGRNRSAKNLVMRQKKK